MRRIRMALGSMAAALVVALGCDTAPPGGGLTNGPAPDLTAEKPGTRTDGADRDRTNQGEMKAAGAEAGLPTGGEKDSGTGGKGGNSGENRPATGGATPAGTTGGAPTATNSAAGATKPSGDIKVGTPKSPQ
jgi:hypothetical protein